LEKERDIESEIESYKPVSFLNFMGAGTTLDLNLTKHIVQRANGKFTGINANKDFVIKCNQLRKTVNAKTDKKRAVLFWLNLLLKDAGVYGLSGAGVSDNARMVSETAGWLCHIGCKNEIAKRKNLGLAKASLFLAIHLHNCENSNEFKQFMNDHSARINVKLLYDLTKLCPVGNSKIESKVVKMLLEKRKLKL